MPQPINFSENAAKDIEEMQNALHTLVKFGIVHEDTANDICFSAKDLLTDEQKEIAEEEIGSWAMPLSVAELFEDDEETQKNVREAFRKAIFEDL